MDQITDAKFHIEESISNVSKAGVMKPQARHSIGTGFPSIDMLGKLNPDFQEPIYPPVEITKPDLDPLFKEIPEALRPQIPQQFRQSITRTAKGVKSGVSSQTLL